MEEAAPFPWQEFVVHCNWQRGKFDRMVDGLTLAALTVSLVRHWLDFSVWERTHILAHMALVLAGVAWRLLDLASYTRWRHYLAPVLRVSLISGPGAWKITTLSLQTWPAGGPGAPVRSFVSGLGLLLFASAVATNCTMALARAVMLPAHIATQAVVLGILLYVRGIVCDTPAFHGPKGRQMLEGWWAAFTWLRAALPVPDLGLSSPPQDAMGLCRGVLGACQLWLGFMLPVAAVAFSEARWFVAFERQLEAQRAEQARRAARGATNGGSRGHLPAPAVKESAGAWGALYHRLAATHPDNGFHLGPLTAVLLAAAAWEVVAVALR